jgi:ATP-dependent Clp protease ATP-binding subunit ClpC
MYERFTDRARKVMQFANQEAQHLNHEFIGTEHVLLGLVKEGSGVAANVLKNLDVDLRKVRREVEKLVLAGPEELPMSKKPQTPLVKKVIEHSMREARNLNHNCVGTEHILLGLMNEPEGVGAQVLTRLGLTLDEIRRATLELLGPAHANPDDSVEQSVLRAAAATDPELAAVVALWPKLPKAVRVGIVAMAKATCHVDDQ